MKQSRNLLAVIAGQSSVVAILVLVLVLAVAGAPLLQQKKVVAENIGTEVAINKAYALSEALLSHAVPRQSLDTFNQAFTARHFAGVLSGAKAGEAGFAREDVRAEGRREHEFVLRFF